MELRTYRNKFLLIDDAQLLQIENLDRKVNEAIKHPEPILRMDALVACSGCVWGTRAISDKVKV